MYKRSSAALAAFSLCAATMLSGVADAQLTHRWSFTGDATDSVGSSNWSVNGATFSGGQVQFDGVDDYLELTSNPLPTANGASTTIEVWGTYDPTNTRGSRIFDISTADGDLYMFLTPNSQPSPTQDNPATYVGWDDNFDIEFGPASTERHFGPSATGEEVLLTLVVDSDTNTPDGDVGQFRLYKDGILIGTQNNDPLLAGILLSTLSGANANRLGHGVSVYDSAAGFPNDPAFLNGSINEMRVSNGALSAVDLFVSAVAGPDALPPTFTANSLNVANGDWGAGGSWSAGVPGATQIATIANGGTATVSSAVATAGRVDVTSGAIVVNSGGDLEALYPIQLSGASSVAVNAGGSLTLSRLTGDADPVVVTDTLTIDGGTVNSGFGNSEIGANVSVVVGAGGATITTQAGHFLNVFGAVEGAGNVVIEGDGTVGLNAGVLNTLTGSVTVNNSTINMARGGFQSLSTASQLVLNNSDMEIDPSGGGDNLILTPIHVADGTVNNIIHKGIGDTGEREPEFRGNLTGDGTLTYLAPTRNGVPIGFDFGDVADNTGFTGRVEVLDDSTPGMFYAVRIRSETADFPNAVFSLGHSEGGTRLGKRGTDLNQTIQLGGLAGAASARLEAAIAGDGEPAAGEPDLRDVVYELGGANEDADFAGTVRDTNPSATISITKVGDNSQALSGSNTYSGPTIVNAGSLLVNGVHASTDDDPLTADVVDATSAVADYTVNAGGTLGGSGTIGRAVDTVDVNVVGGAIAPGASVGTLTVVGNVSLGDGSSFLIEGMGSSVDSLVSQNLTIGPNVDVDVTELSPVAGGSYVIAQYSGTRTGTFASVTSGYTLDYGTPGQVLLVVTASNLPGDFNGDGKVDILDLDILSGNFGTSGGATLSQGDANGDGNVDILDLDILSGNFGAMASASASIPEPATLALLMAGLSLTAVRRR